MIFLKLTDGLGNQMFQYAFARYVQTVYGGKIYLDITKLGKRHVRSYGLDIFELNKDVVIPPRIIQYLSRLYTKLIRLFLTRVMGWSILTEEGYHNFIRVGYYTTNGFYQHFSFRKTFVPIKFVRGYYQNPTYFKDISQIIRQELRLKETKRSDAVEALAVELRSCNSICLHIRRGDFLKYDKFNVCTEDYYKKGIAYVRSQSPNTKVYVFSNTHKDIEWIRANYHLGSDINYVDMGNSEADDLYLMMQCRHFVISNSTYSWWAAYLSDHLNKIVVAPKPWVNSDEQQDGIYCENWHVIEITGK